MHRLNPIRPLAQGFRETRAVLPSYTPEQRRAIVAANAVTFGRLALRLAVEFGYDQQKLSRRQALVAHSALDLADKIDGWLIRRVNAQTPWGDVADPYADKIDFLIQELFRVSRGELGVETLLLRQGRDTASTIVRTQASESVATNTGNGKAAASKWGKRTTAGRSVTLRVSDAFPNTRLAKICEHSETAALLASLGYNIVEYRRRNSETVSKATDAVINLPFEQGY